MLSNPAFFPKGKSFFLQIEPDTAAFPELISDGGKMHPHYYWLKKAVHKKREHLFPYLINAKDFKKDEDMEILKKLAGVQSYHDLNNL